ncbi:MAG: DNA repair protein RecO [Dehalococcoides mccartyi]|jgi:DNA repair protein RecO|uniref:DNA repair protein RecO n=2 Tax=root TaxID=1 RepID=A0A0V8M4A1_9CHLR|nr:MULTISPECIES: DNA repair protein RecO [Dehalococcoides]AII59261.1 DNA repair protein RecO [Dehalococcoides mccartyi CG4]AQU02969.1 DNA repair protein RecO [Dehalococcoides mccartyi]AQU04286.1 DNA repair protein RecO [Dehalococcoides mccartyi]KSV18615.1 DNA recombination protein RecO [Dehalococcoides mccartyi]MBF4482742.1 DNA repair protein RecO [Dehalococcoides mccartyi]
MTKPHDFKTRAIIVRKTKCGEADRILSLLTPDLGLIQGFAKSVRKTKSKLSGHLELFCYSEVSLARGKAIDTVTGSQTIQSFLNIRSSLQLSAMAFYVCELAFHFSPEESANPAIFQLLLSTLEELDNTTQAELCTKYFEIHLLEMSGYKPELRECANCHQKLLATTNYFSPESGGIICPDCRNTQTGIPISVNAVKVLRYIQENDIPNIYRLKINREILSELELAIRANIRFVLEKEPKALLWLDSLRMANL